MVIAIGRDGLEIIQAASADAGCWCSGYRRRVIGAGTEATAIGQQRHPHADCNDNVYWRFASRFI